MADNTTKLYTNNKSADMDMVSLYLYFIEGGIIFVFNFVLALIIFLTKKLRVQKEFVLFGINMIFDALYGFAYILGGFYRLRIYLYEEYIPLQSRWICLLNPSSQMFAILIPGVGIISLITTIDRLISVSVPMRYFTLTVSYTYALGLLAVGATLPTYILAMITSYETRDIYDANGLCNLQQSAITEVYIAFRGLRVGTSIVGVFLYLPIFLRLYKILNARTKMTISNVQGKKLRQMTFTVTLITINELLLFTVPDICLILNPSTNTFFFFILNMTKGIVNIIIFLLTQKELRKAVFRRISDRFLNSTIVDVRIQSHSMVLRFNEKGLHGLADYTRMWMNESISSMSIESYTHKIHKGIAAGDLNLQNIKVARFFPPLIRYRSSEHGLYMTTLGGQSDIQAEWDLDSDFLSLFAIPFKGEVQGRIAGLRSEVSVKINPGTNEFEVHHCAAKFNDFRIRLSGSIAADILHWFRSILGKAMKKRVEETYCKMISQKLLPWLQHQLTKFPNYLHVNFGNNIELSQGLHSIALSSTHVDLRMKNKFITNGHLIETLSTLPSSYPNYERNQYLNQKMVELFIDEPTLQEIASAAHFSDQFRANMTSPFLRTDCEMLCLGTLFPELKTQLGPTKLVVEVKTLSAPIIRLLEDRAFVFINSSVEIFDSNSLNSIRENDIIDNNIDIINPILFDPVISIEVSGEAELFIQIEERKLSGNLKLRNTKAIVLESKLTDMSQKTIDFIVNLSVPFLEDAIQVFLGEGTQIDDIFKVNTRNETLTIHDGFIRLQTDLTMEHFLD